MPGWLLAFFLIVIGAGFFALGTAAGAAHILFFVALVPALAYLVTRLARGAPPDRRTRH